MMDGGVYTHGIVIYKHHFVDRDDYEDDYEVHMQNVENMWRENSIVSLTLVVSYYPYFLCLINTFVII